MVLATVVNYSTWQIAVDGAYVYWAYRDSAGVGGVTKVGINGGTPIPVLPARRIPPTSW